MKPNFKPCPNCEDAFCTGFSRGWQAGNAKEYFNHNQTLGEYRGWIAAMLQIGLNKIKQLSEFEKRLGGDMKKLLLITLLFATSAEAQSLGCFSLNETPNVCANNSYICAPTYQGDVQTAGVLVAGLCEELRIADSEIFGCNRDFNLMSDLAIAHNKLIKKLRKACGSKCKKIK